MPVDVGRVGRDGQQQRQDRAQAVADADGPVGALDADVDVQRERVVAPRDVVQARPRPGGSGRVDDVLVAVVRQRVRAGRAERDAVLVGEREEAAARLVLAPAGVGEVLAAAGADLDLRGDQLARDRVAEQRVCRPASRRRSNAGDQLERVGSRRANSSSMPTVSPSRLRRGRARRRRRSWGARSGRSRARRAGRRRGSTCGP